VTLGELTPTVIFGLLGLLLTGILEYKRVKGGILIGIVFTTALAGIFGEAAMPENFVAQPESMAPLVMELDIVSALKISLIGPIFSFMFVDLFDSIGTIIACAYQAKLNDKDGNVPGLKKVLMADAAATIIGSGLGTSTTTTYIESASGIAEGAKTGLASVFTAICFMLALFFSPLALAIPAYATAPALIIVGAYMFKNVSAIKFDDLTESLPAFFTVVFMPLTYSVSTGMTFGFLSYVLLKVFTGQAKSVSTTMWVIGALSLVNLLV
jgi:AGZA family xanthine/uracil permease-like MFS transporter